MLCSTDMEVCILLVIYISVKDNYFISKLGVAYETAFQS